MSYIWKSNVETFIDTRKKSQSVYKEDTEKLLRNTQVYRDADIVIDDSELLVRNDMKIKIVAGGTVSTAYNIDDSNCRIAILNFADAKRPGGWVKEGAPTQEENICRCTNLYETLIQPFCKANYYDVNLNAGIPDAEHHYDEPYTDALIYSEKVAIFKDDVTYKDIPVKYVDVITSPAPCGEVDDVEIVLMHRIRGIIKAAYLHGVTHIVLGAWGCGAFGQNPKVVAKCFKRVLSAFPVFKVVIFAIRPTGVANKKFARDYVFDAFDRVFKQSLFLSESREE